MVEIETKLKMAKVWSKQMSPANWNKGLARTQFKFAPKAVDKNAVARELREKFKL